jgi:hypothetical protein
MKFIIYIYSGTTSNNKPFSFAVMYNLMPQTKDGILKPHICTVDEKFKGNTVHLLPTSPVKNSFLHLSKSFMNAQVTVLKTVLKFTSK